MNRAAGRPEQSQHMSRFMAMRLVRGKSVKGKSGGEHQVLDQVDLPVEEQSSDAVSRNQGTLDGQHCP